jgi:asparaginyl-tRNA synthetase
MDYSDIMIFSINIIQKRHFFKVSITFLNRNMTNSKHITIEEAISKFPEEKQINLRGWVYRERKSNKFIFLVLRDESDIIQCVIKKNKTPKLFEKAQDLTIESSIKIRGELREDSRAPTGYEVGVTELEIVQIADPFPITEYQSIELLLENRHLWLRSRKINAILKIRHTIVGAIHEFFRKRGYFEFDAPIFQPSMSEGGATLFKVNYFEDVVYLSQSWQLYAEAGIFSLGKIYNMGPTFRAEKSSTSRHLSEFWMAEMEAAWMELDEVIEVAKDEIRFIIKEVIDKNKKELELLERDISILENYAHTEYPTIKYAEALKILNNTYDMNVPWGKDLRTIEEKTLAEHFNVPVVVSHYPTEIMGFYKPPSEENPEEALCFDMIAPEGYCEIIGGSQRSLSIENMKKRLEAEGEDPGKYQWYFDLRRYGSVPHSGYGVGVERVVSWICGLENIKDAIPFPRTMDRKEP